MCNGNGSCTAGTSSTCAYGCTPNGTSCCQSKRPSSANKLTNPGFDGTLDGWSASGYMPGPNFDSDGCPGSGSGDVSSLTAQLDQCVNVTSGSFTLTYRFKGYDSSSNTGICYVNYYSIPCPNAISDFDFAIGNVEVHAPSSGNWVQAQTPPLAALPAGTKSAHVYCVPMLGFGYYDQIYFGNSSSVTF